MCVALQLDDAEFSSTAAIKAKKRMELEIQDLHQQIEEFSRSKQEVGFVLFQHCSVTGLVQLVHLRGSLGITNQIAICLACTVVTGGFRSESNFDIFMGKISHLGH